MSPGMIIQAFRQCNCDALGPSIDKASLEPKSY